MTRTYTFTADPGHGWIHVSKAELRRLGIANRITSYSYMHGEMAYLEEDCDFSTFAQAKRDHGEEFSIDVRHVNSTPIRGYRSYSPG
jgi:hypothetical protein